MRILVFCFLGAGKMRPHVALEKVLKLGVQISSQAGSRRRQLNEVRIGLLHLVDIAVEILFVFVDLLLEVSLKILEELGICLGVETGDAPEIVAEQAIQEMLGRAKEEHTRC